MLMVSLGTQFVYFTVHKVPILTLPVHLNFSVKSIQNVYILLEKRITSLTGCFLLLHSVTETRLTSKILTTPLFLINYLSHES
jgi:hypothetical protein